MAPRAGFEPPNAFMRVDIKKRWFAVDLKNIGRVKNGSSGRIRTSDQLINSQLLYH